MSAMTDIIDRLRSAGDDEAADALSHARHVTQELRRGLTAKDALIAKLREAIKPFGGIAAMVDAADVMVDDNEEMIAGGWKFSLSLLYFRAARAAYQETENG